MTRPEVVWSNRTSLPGVASRRRRMCHVLSALLMAIVASPMAGFALQMQGPAVFVALFGSESESEEDTSSDASEFGEMLCRPRERNRRHHVNSLRVGGSVRHQRSLAGVWLRSAHIATERGRVSRDIPLRC